MSEPEISGSEAARLWLYTEPLWEAGPTSALRKSMQEADERIAAAERECDQLRARQETAMQFADQYQAENAKLRALLRQVQEAASDYRDCGDTVLDLIDSSGLLDDEGQQP